MLANVDLNTWVLAGVAIMNALTLYYTRQTEKNTNSLVTSLVNTTAAASDAAGAERARKEGELKAALVKAAGHGPASVQPPPSDKTPLPVADDRTAKAAERTAAAAEGSAKATERVADATEKVSKKPPG